MKNFPEQNSSDELRKKLEGYTEQPDDLVWKNIDQTLRPHRVPVWAPWSDVICTAAFVVLFAALFNTQTQIMTAPPGNIDGNVDEKHQARSAELPTEEISDHFKNTTKTQATTNIQPGAVSSKNRIRQSLSRHHIANETVSSVQNQNIEGGLSDMQTSNLGDGNQFFINDKGMDSGLVASPTAGIDSIEIEAAIPPKTQRRKRGLTFYLSVTPQLSFQRVVPVSQDGIVVTDISTQRIFSGERLAVNVEFGLQGKLKGRFEYYAGMSVFQQGQRLKYEYQVTSNVDVASTDELSYSVNPRRQTGTVNLAMLNIGANAGLLYHLQGEKFAHKVGAGLSYQYGSREHLAESEGKFSAHYLLYQLHYRNELQLSRKLRLFIQPTFSQAFHVSEKLDAPLKIKPYRAGLGVGLLYRL